MRTLTLKEQEIFRKDLQDKERDIQKYIGVYLSGLVLVTGWIIGPQSRPLLVMALGNSGHNAFGFLIFVALNVLFINFLIYKSILIHELAQFVSFMSDREGAFLYWETWRRGSQSASRRVRTTYTVLLAVLPISISFLILFGLWRLIHTDPLYLANQYALLTQATTAAGERVGPVLTGDEIASVFARVKVFWFVAALLHLIPFWFIFDVRSRSRLRSWRRRKLSLPSLANRGFFS